MRILTFGTLYPDATRPSHGVFVEHRLRQLLAQGGVEARVVSPVPWFPSGHTMFGAWAGYARVPRREVRHGITVEHPRYLQIPRVGMTLTPRLLAAAAAPVLRRIIRDGFDFDLIDAQYFFPDGVAATRLGRLLNKPVAITARGTDLNLIPQLPGPRRLIQSAARDADCLITVCQALKDTLVGLGTPAGKVTVLRNGVDLDLFQPLDHPAMRARLGLTAPTLLTVGHLIPRKGNDLVIEAMQELPGHHLAIVGDGPEEHRLRAAAIHAGVADRVRFVGRVDQQTLAAWYSAADALVLASDREGWANVLLEAMACGTPVVATAIWGTPEVVTAPEAGVLVTERSPAAIADGVRRLFAALPSRAATRTYAAGFSWDRTAIDLKALFARTIEAFNPRAITPRAITPKA